MTKFKNTIALAVAAAITIPALAMAAENTDSTYSRHLDHHKTRITNQQAYQDDTYNDEDSDSWIMNCFRRFRSQHRHHHNHCDNW